MHFFLQHFHRSSLSKKKRKMEYKYNTFDSPSMQNTHSKHSKKSSNVIKRKNVSCQTESMCTTIDEFSSLDLKLGTSPSVTPCKAPHAIEINSSPDLVPGDDASSSAYMSAESLKTDPAVTVDNKNVSETHCEAIPVIQKDMDAMSINFETPYLCNHKRVQRKLSLPQIKLLKKNSSQESDSPPDVTPGGSSGKKLFSTNSSSSSRFFSSLKKRKHALKRALSFQNSSTSSEDKVQSSELDCTNDTQKKESDKPNTV